MEGKTSGAAPEYGFKWITLVQFGMKMWGDLPLKEPPKRDGIMTKVLTDAEFDAIWRNPDILAKDRVYFDEPFWRELSAKLRASGCNCLMIDVGEALAYPSHPELAVKGSWPADKLRAEVSRLRGMGFEVFPKLNFSTSHDAWLGPYERMVATPKYYEVCADVIRDAVEVFAPVANFHIGFDEEDVPVFHSNSSVLVMRQGDLWWHDLNWLVREVERHGARAWAWSDYLRRHTKEQFDREFRRRMPKTVVQNPWMYWTKKDKMDTEPYIQAFLTLAEAGYDVAPCGSNCYGVTENFPDMSEYCHERIAPERLKGMIMAPWIKTIPEYRRLHWQAADIISEAIARSARARRERCDVVIYGSTPAAISAAVQAKRMGRSAVVVSPETRIGGLTTGGLGQTDIGSKAAFGGIALEFYRAVAAHYADRSSWTRQTPESYFPDGQCAGSRGKDSMWTFEPSAALAILEGWEKRDGLDIRRGERLDREHGVEVKDGRIVAIRTLSGSVYRGGVFIDATYEGDLMAAAGVSCTVGREANSVYGETLNGNQPERAVYHQLNPGTDPYVVAGDPSSGLLPGIEPYDPNAKTGDGDRRVQAYCFRMCLTDDPENRIPFAKPDGYDERDYELLFRHLAIAPLDHNGMPWINSRMPNRKTDTNNRTGFATDFIGQSWAWPEASYDERERMRAAHLKYQKGLMWTLANHPRVPEAIRAEVSKWGTCRDEFLDGLGDGWQSQLYVREARRLVGEYVMTEHNCWGRAVAPNPVAMAAYTMDSHHVRRHVGADGFAHNEGDVQVRADAQGRKFGPYPIGYGAITPKRAECSNLLVPVCVSASHIAFGSIRMEPVFFALGQAAGTAAAIAAEKCVAVQDVPYGELSERLRADGQVLGLAE